MQWVRQNMGTGKVKSRRRLRRTLWVLCALLLFVGGWLGWRWCSWVSCSRAPEAAAAAYTETDRVLNAIALCNLAYGCEGCQQLSGTVSELLDKNEMGILTENFGILRTDPAEPASALFDAEAFVRRTAGGFRFLMEREDVKSGFYGVAFCDDRAKCVWVAFSGSVTLRDALACAELLLSPGLSRQEKQAIQLYEAVLESEEVRAQGYTVLLTGHSLGGSLATMVACSSGCDAVTINGADGIAAGKYRGMHTRSPRANSIMNYLTSPKSGRFSLMDLVQRLMFLGGSPALDERVYPENGCTTDTHSVFSFLVFEDADFSSPKLPASEY